MKKNKEEIIEKLYQKFKGSTEGKLMHACNKDDETIIRNLFNKMLLPYIESSLEERDKQVQEAVDDLEEFFIADYGAGDWHKRFPRIFTVHFDIAREKMGLKPKHHPRYVKNLAKEHKKFIEDSQ